MVRGNNTNTEDKCPHCGKEMVLFSKIHYSNRIEKSYNCVDCDKWFKAVYKVEFKGLIEEDFD